ncbi:hypothetical protein FOQG_08878 [Fusarium oxysporum f. sp. raphani 54005]|uniref:Uncharacterized protein n=2 Tax=Fusarium oxysporum f. sp. raphani TaxID=96318 RepID=X0BZB8_FUSOX|nr:hypothetical protein FOQG_08878 [Fusarium oxysporum f. sp. raphani 54005]KAG7427786.1 hypothetical protein Forpi1262_v010927 [Fusarium oxysporum f. sp. raphani]
MSDVITEDFDVNVFLDLFHWSFEDAYRGTHEPERPVSPFSQPGFLPTELITPRFQMASFEEQRLSLDCQVSSSLEKLGVPDRDGSFGITNSTDVLPALDPLSSGHSSQSSINRDNSPSAQASNLKRTSSSKTDDSVPKRICREAIDDLCSVTDEDLPSTPESPENWTISCGQLLAPCRDNHELHNSSVDDRCSGKQHGASDYDDDTKGHKDFVIVAGNVCWAKHR